MGLKSSVYTFCWPMEGVNFKLTLCPGMGCGTGRMMRVGRTLNSINRTPIVPICIYLHLKDRAGSKAGIKNRLDIKQITNYFSVIRSTAVRLASILGVGLVTMSKADPSELFFWICHAKNCHPHRWRILSETVAYGSSRY